MCINEAEDNRRDLQFALDAQGVELCFFVIAMERPPRSHLSVCCTA